MLDDVIKQVLIEMNDTMSSIYAGEIFVADIKIDSIEYYYDKNIGKIKVKIGTRQNQNNEIFKNQNIQNAFNDFLQVLANELNDEFTNSKNLESRVNNAINNIND